MLPLNPATLAQQIREAAALHGAGQAEEAERRYRSILAVQPDNAVVHFHLGRLLAARKSPDALDHFSSAAELKPSEPAVWQAWVAAALGSSDPEARAAVLQRAKALRIDSALLKQMQARLDPQPVKLVKRPSIGGATPTEVKALLADYDARRMPQAERKALAILQKAPDSALVADILGNVRLAQGKHDAALQAFRLAVRLEPGWPDSQASLGATLLHLDKTSDALEVLRRAAALAPAHVRSQILLARALVRAGDSTQALAALKRAADADPRHAEAQFQLGMLLSDLRNPGAALAAYRASEAAGNRSADLQLRMGQALLLQRDEDGAEARYRLGLERAPDHALLHSQMGLLLQGRGDFQAAEQCFRRAISLKPGNGEFYRLLGATRKLTPDDPLVAEMQRHFDDPSTADSDRRSFAFALAKAMEDTKQHERVFTYLRPANDLMRKAYPYDIRDRRREVDSLLSSFRDFDPERAPAKGSSDYAPIFVTGMPRSGTTLVEQIIASHSRVTGAGEVGVAAREAQRAILDERTHRWQPSNELSDDAIAAIGHRYEAQLRSSFPDAMQVTDKSIQTHAYMGLLRLALPKAKFVVVRRDPRDTLLSIYRNVFAENTHLYAYNLRDLGLYYRMFEEVIDFWRSRIPGWFYEIEYERLVANPEEEARKLIDACGLPWEDACLNFHENKRRVETLSVYQVRQPVYTSSLRAWERYAADLGEMFDALEGGNA